MYRFATERPARYTRSKSCDFDSRLRRRIIANQAERRFLPLSLRRLRTARPAFVLMRLRNPWVFFRFLLLGWYVRFTRPLSFPIHIVASLRSRSLKGREVYKWITEQSIAPPEAHCTPWAARTTTRRCARLWTTHRGPYD